MEIKEAGERMEAEAKTAILANNPELYEALYGEDDSPIDDDNVDWIVPRSQKDLDWIMQEIKEAP